MRDALIPYREAPAEPRFVCISCWQTLSSVPGHCSICDVDRLDLGRPEVREEVRRYAEEQLLRRERSEAGALFAVSFATGFTALAASWTLLALLGLAPDELFGTLVVFATAAGLAVHVTLARTWVRLRPRSAIAVLAARRRRLLAEMGGQAFVLGNTDDAVGRAAAAAHAIDQETRRAATRVDPEVARVHALLRSFGARVE